jgi:hypothetical protein
MIRSLPCDERRARTAYQHHARVFGLRSSSTSRARRRPRSSRAVQRFTRACALRCAARARDRVTGSGRVTETDFSRERRAACPVGNGKRVWVCLAILRITHYACPEACLQSQMQTPLPRLGPDPRAARASPRTDVQTRACGVKEPQPVDSRRHDADRPDPLDPRRRRANKDTKRIQTETGERRECEKLSRRGGRVGSPGGVWACTCTTRDERRS